MLQFSPSFSWFLSPCPLLFRSTEAAIKGVRINSGIAEISVTFMVQVHADNALLKDARRVAGDVDKLAPKPNGFVTTNAGSKTQFLSVL